MGTRGLDLKSCVLILKCCFLLPPHHPSTPPTRGFSRGRSIQYQAVEFKCRVIAVLKSLLPKNEQAIYIKTLKFQSAVPWVDGHASLPQHSYFGAWTGVFRYFPGIAQSACGECELPPFFSVFLGRRSPSPSPVFFPAAFQDGSSNKYMNCGFLRLEAFLCLIGRPFRSMPCASCLILRRKSDTHTR